VKMLDRDWRPHLEDGRLLLRASAIGSCVRAQVMTVKGYDSQEPSRETRLTWDIGRALEPVILQYAGYDLARVWFRDQVEATVKVSDTVSIIGHPDGEYEGWTLEAKTMRAWPFRKVKNDGLMMHYPQYLMQASIYVWGCNTRGVKFYILGKDESQIIEEVWTAEDLQPYYEKAINTALFIQRQLGKKRLPGKPKDLPSWACQSKYCLFWQCPHNEKVQKKGRAIYRNKVKKAQKEYVPGHDFCNF